MNISDLIPANVKAFLQALAGKVDGLLQGETLRAIQYGGGAIVFLVAKYAKIIPDVSFNDAVLQVVIATGILVSFVESARHFVFSPATVAAIVLTPPTAAGPIAAAADAGVDIAK